MSNPFLKNLIKQTTILLFILGSFTLLFAEGEVGNRGFIQSRETPEVKKDKDKVIYPESAAKSATRLTPIEEEKLSELQKTARMYRNQGFEMQKVGNLEGALSYYQKAIELDPFYAVAYNDAGVIYESQGLNQRAEESYLKSIQIDPTYLSAYSNLALFYENQRDLKKASFYWEKRVQLGLPDDPWTQKAQMRLEDIRLALGEKVSGLKEREVIGLVKEIAEQKAVLRQDDKAVVNKHFEKAKFYYAHGDEAAALKEAIDAQQIDPKNKKIEEFIDKVRKRLLSR